MEITNKYNLPEPLVSVIKNDPYEFDGDISTTALLSPIRIRQLNRRYRDELVEDVADNIYRLIGSNTHHILERINIPNCIKEERYYARVGGWKLGGQIDLYETVPLVLSDYKVTSVWSVIRGVKPEHEAQMNINAFLMRENGIHPKKLQMVSLLRDWSKFKANEENYPSCQCVVQEAEMWPENEAREWVENRVALHQLHEDCPDGKLPLCTEEERWTEITKYAIMKKGRKSALRVLDSEKDAEQYMKDKKLDDKHEIVVRPGADKRCAEYCSVNLKCNHYNKELK